MTKTEEKKEPEFVLPDKVILTTQTDCRDLVIISQPKMGKSSIFGMFTQSENALLWELEKGGLEYVSARKMSIYPSQETTLGEAYENYIKQRNLLLENKGKYGYLLIDGLSDLDSLSELGGTYKYMQSIQGKSFNRKDGQQLEWGDPEFKLVTTLPDGAGYMHTRIWFLNQIDMFRQIAPYRIYGAHVVDKYIKDNGKDQVVGSEISLTGKLKVIFAAKVTALGKLIAEGEKRYLNFEVLNDSLIAGSRNPKLTGKILISEKGKDGKITTFWENIYSKNR